jgi:hypothetical protein
LTGTDRNRQDYISDIENYCIIKKFIYQIGNPEVGNRQEQTGLYTYLIYKIIASSLLYHKEIHISDRKCRSKEQTGTDRIIYLI